MTKVVNPALLLHVNLQKTEIL